MNAPLVQRLFGISFKAEPAHTVRELVTRVRDASGDRGRKLIVGRAGDTVVEVYKLFESWDLHHLPVLSDSSVIGIVSSTDVLRFFADPAHSNAAQTTLAEIMTSDPRVINADAPLSTLIKILASSNFQCLPVVDDDGAIFEIVTTRDLVRFLELTME